MTSLNRVDPSPPPGVGASAPLDTVVLLHGWLSGTYFLKRVEARLRAEGFRVILLDYPSVGTSAEALSEKVLPKTLSRLRIPPDRPLHFVTHSMGGLVLRGLCARKRPENLGRAVMLGPPNQGSEAADFWARSALVRRLAGPNLAALGTGTQSFARTLPAVDFPLLVIAGSRPLCPFWSPLPRPHDGRVSVASTRVPGMTAHRVLQLTHSVLPWSRRVLDLTSTFLRDGAAGLDEA